LVSYIAKKHKISIEVFDTAGIECNWYPCRWMWYDTGRGFWWTDDIDNVNNPLYVEGGFVVKVKNNGNSRKNVSRLCYAMLFCWIVIVVSSDSHDRLSILFTIRSACIPDATFKRV